MAMMTATGEDDSGEEREAEQYEVPHWELSASENHSSDGNDTNDSETCGVGSTVSLDKHSNSNQDTFRQFKLARRDRKNGTIIGAS